MSERIFNFSAGPAVLPEPVLKKAQADLFAIPGVGMSILEVSHRSATFEQVIKEAEEDLRKLLGVPENYKVLFLQGGASLQFTMIPMNLLPKGAKRGLHPHGKLGTGRDQGSQKARHSARSRDDSRHELQSPAEIGRHQTRPERRLRSLHLERNYLWRGVSRMKPVTPEKCR
jgi:phosphoserine aminotransferase